MNIILRTVSLFLLLIFTGCTNNDDEIRILFTGDILLSRNVREEYQRRGESPWTHLIPLFQQADLIVGNLEGAVGDTINGTSAGSNHPEHPSSLIFDIRRGDISISTKPPETYG